MRIGVLIAFALLAVPHPTPAQLPVPVRVPYRPSCTTCKIELTKVVSFGKASDPSLITTLRPARDSRGRYFAAASGELKVVVFDSTGRYLTAFGRPGEGPGELGQIIALPSGQRAGGIARIHVDHGDSIHVFHHPGHISIFTPDFKFVRRLRIPVPTVGGAALLRKGMVVAANISTPDRIGHHFHVFDDTGGARRSFGWDGKPVIRGVTPLPNIRAPFVVSHDERSLWVMSDTAFILRQWLLDGTPGSVLEFTNIPWIRPIVYYDTILGRASQPTRLPRPHTLLSLAAVDSAGRLWINSILPEDAPRTSAHPARNALHVVDPRTRTILLTQPLEKEIRFIAPNLTYTFTTDKDGVVTMTVWRVRLVLD